MIGFTWLCLTVLIEFTFGYLQGVPWSVLIEAYRFKDGNMWPIVLLVLIVAPYLSASIRGRHKPYD